MSGELSNTTKSFQFELRLANQIGRINFVRLNVSYFNNVQKFIGFQYFLFPETIGYE